MEFEFMKMHGAGNDFVVVDDCKSCFPIEDTATIRQLCDPHTGLGTEGFIVVRPSSEAAFRMVFFNPDGSRADMCGNGARCAAFFAHLIGLADREHVFLSDAGQIRATILKADKYSASVRIVATNPSDRRPVVCGMGTYHVNTGVPHLVVLVDNAELIDVDVRGRELRFAPVLSPVGANVDFVQVLDRHAVVLRTYERGVEAETAACGTGAIAAAVATIEMGLCDSPVRVRVRFGVDLEVGAQVNAAGLCSDITLTGPAEVICRGVLRV